MKLRLLALALVACSSSATSSDPTALTEPLSPDMAIAQIAVLQVVKVPIMDGGNAVDSGIPVVALRDAVVRVYVQPQATYQPHPLTARARIETTGPMGTEVQVFSATATIDRPTLENDLTTSFDIAVPGVALEPGSSITVVINDTSGDPSDSTTSFAKWPMDGSSADLGVKNGGDRVRVEIVPVQYNADGSHRLPDTSDAQLEAYRERFMQLYPTASVEITVRDPWPWSGAIGFDGTGMQTLLQALQQLRGQDQPDSDVYYYAAFEPASSFQSFCGGGCVTGLTLLGAPLSVGIGYADPATMDTATHEVGHAHGLDHAPCGPVSGVDPNYPYKTGTIGVWGYDSIGQAMIDPAVYKDIMSYCDPKWISDYDYGKIFKRVRTDNKYFNDWIGPRTRYAAAPMPPSGAIHVSNVLLREPWITLGEPRPIAWPGGSATGYFFPYDHLPGGVLYVPDEVPSGAELRGKTVTTILR